MSPSTATSVETTSRAIEALDYEFPQIIRRYQDKLGLDEAAARLLWEDTKKFLYLAGTNPGTRMSPTEALDDGWHEFLMYTKQYTGFCQTYFGRFLHHVPDDPMNPPVGRPRVIRTRELAEEAFGVEALSPNWTLPPIIEKIRRNELTDEAALASDPCLTCQGCQISCDFE
jgi:hypothetical protein